MVVATANQPAWKLLSRFRGEDYPADEILRHFRIERPPVPVADIARALGAKVFIDEIEAAGILDPDSEDGLAITVRAGDSRERQRFTIAHEIGHLVLHPLGRMYRDPFMSFAEGPEREASRFAAELLMPEWYVRPAFRRMKGNLRELAKLFSVSHDAMRIRFRELYGPQNGD